MLESETETVLGELQQTGSRYLQLIDQFLESARSLANAKEDVERKINELKVEQAELKTSTKDRLREASGQLCQAETMIETNRRLLVSLAQDTITRNKSIMEYFDMLDDPDVLEDMDALKECIHTSVEDFILMMKASQPVLAKADSEYREVLKMFVNIKVNLNAYKDDIRQMMDQNSAEYRSWTTALRLSIYPSALATGSLGGPAGVAVATASAAALLESAIQKYTKELNEKKISVENACEALDRLLKDVDRKADFVQEEIQLVKDWSMTLQQALDKEKDMTEMKDKLSKAKSKGMIKIVLKKKELIVKTLIHLSDACQKYIDHKM